MISVSLMSVKVDHHDVFVLKFKVMGLGLYGKSHIN